MSDILLAGYVDSHEDCDEDFARQTLAGLSEYDVMKSLGLED